MYKIVRFYGGELCSLDGSHAYEEGVRYDGLFFVYPDLENAVLYARSFAEIFSHLLVYEVDCEPLPVIPSRYPVLAAPCHLKQQWAELVKAGRISEAEQLFAGELQVYTYPTVDIVLSQSFILRRPLIRFRNYFDQLTKSQRRVVTVLDQSVDAEIVLDCCYGWEVKVHGGDQVSV